MLLRCSRRVATPLTNFLLHGRPPLRRHLATTVAAPPPEHVMSVVSRQITDIPHIKFLQCGYNLRIKPNDILNPDDVNSLRASLVSSDPGSAAPGTIHIDITTSVINIINTDVNPDPNITCVLELPVQSELTVVGTKNIHVEKLYSDSIALKTPGDIRTHSVNGFKFDFESTAGNIHCSGTTLANQINVRTRGFGNIQLDKMQGDLLYAINDSGSITTNACYVEASKFVTLNGRLHLQNVHKFAEMYLLEGGQMEVSGFHGKLLAKLNGGRGRFQLTEVYGDSRIEQQLADDSSEELVLNVSDFVLENNAVRVDARRIELEQRLDDCKECLDAAGKTFRKENANVQASDEDSLTVRSSGVVRMGRMSWTDTLRLKFNA